MSWLSKSFPLVLLTAGSVHAVEMRFSDSGRPWGVGPECKLSLPIESQNGLHPSLCKGLQALETLCTSTSLTTTAANNGESIMHRETEWLILIEPKLRQSRFTNKEWARLPHDDRTRIVCGLVGESAAAIVRQYKTSFCRGMGAHCGPYIPA
jgi:hypothetical protein